MAQNYNIGNLGQKLSVDLTANTISVTSANTLSVTNLVLTGFVAANGTSNTGTAGQALTTNGTGVYWSTIVGTNTAAQYTWTNTHTFSNVVTFTANVSVNGAIILGGSNGTVGQVLTSNGTSNTFWSTVPNTSVSWSWTNTHTFSNVVTFTANVSVNGALFVSGSNGSVGQVLTSNGTSNTFWSTVPNTSVSWSWTNTHTFNSSATANTISTVITNIAEPATITGSGVGTSYNFYVQTQSVVYFNVSATANWTVNFTGSSAGQTLNNLLSTGQAITVVIIAQQGGTAYYNTSITVDGNSVTPKWQGGTAPTAGNASSWDTYTYTIIKTGTNTWFALVGQTQFK